MTDTAHTQTGITHDADGWRVRCSCGWRNEKACNGPWSAQRRWDVHNAEAILARAAAR